MSIRLTHIFSIIVLITYGFSGNLFMDFFNNRENHKRDLI